MAEGVILLGHGSRRAEANEEIRQISRMVADLNPGLYETAFLSFCSPNLAEAVVKLKQAGAVKIIITPIFLANGNHIALDIPEEIEGLKSDFPDVEFLVADHIGPDPGVAEIVKERIVQARAKMSAKAV
ncbi:Cobalamin (vitamin B12) biosynthesis CbiX [Syntrophomonas zehnderi OL-4]|uniref:Cobalamin (Vitamin B12) biosynthesis CbiX n=1 Tax=Syntrophomonas zehnderi OL-4 TaxID=690567 RepID=A0A0E4C9P6_9FIRM|nr:CbiX/SirB N-terminal domain-containing protein [Syntrophomonas zehnderi]CFY06917.1 Cobalamin (vitamin B12) biosynthesis CbiX [Syntrophomonas zehnderi OL-4]